MWRCFEDNWIGTFGVPTLLISYRGAQFTSNYWAKQCQVFGIHSETTPAYHSEVNGMVERWHRTLKNSISCDRYSDKNWASRLLIILLGLRVRPHLDSGLSPHQQAFGMELVRRLLQQGGRGAGWSGVLRATQVSKGQLCLPSGRESSERRR